MRRLSALALLAVLAGCQPSSEYLETLVNVFGPPQPTPDGLVGEDPRPVVVTGADLPGLIGVAPEDVVAFAVRDGDFAPIPVQVDERFFYDLATVYTGMSPKDCARRAWCRDLDGHVEHLGYADPNTHVGPDPDATVDADDEVALMLADFGEVATGHPSGVDPRTAAVLTVAVDGETRAAYLYRRTDSRLDPAAGKQYVRYTPHFVRGEYLETYERGGRRPPWMGWPTGNPSRDRLGSNPERTRVETGTYTLGFADRWILNRMEIGGGADLLDVDMIAFAPGVCWRSPYTGSLSEGGFLVNRSGPVRALRHVVGFNSGPLVDGQWTFYARHAESVVNLRVHPIPGAMSFLDLSEEAVGMVYRNEANPGGALVDGHADALEGSPVSWESWSGPDGAFGIRHRFDTDGFVPNIVSYHIDNAEPNIDACMLDGAYYGAHGLYLDGTIPNTDPRRGEAARVALHRQFAFGEDPEARLAVLGQPVAVTVRVPAPDGRERTAEG